MYPIKLILTLDLTRRENDKKVIAVKLQMLDTVIVLFRYVSGTTVRSNGVRSFPGYGKYKRPTS